MHLVRSVQVHLGGLWSNSMQLSWKSLLCSPGPLVCSHPSSWLIQDCLHGSGKSMKIICLNDSYLLAHIVSMAGCQRQSETYFEKVPGLESSHWASENSYSTTFSPPLWHWGKIPNIPVRQLSHWIYGCKTVPSHKVMVRSSGILHCTLHLVDRKCLLWLRWRQWTHNFNIQLWYCLIKVKYPNLMVLSKHSKGS